MDGKRSRAAVLEFHDYMARKGLMAKPTAMARKAALGKVLGVLSDDEAQDVTSLNIDDVMTRFTHLEGRSYTPDSLTTYKSRVKSALDDFANYLSNPMAFRPSIGGKKSRIKIVRSKPKSEIERDDIATPPPPVASPSFTAANILPIPLRADLTVRIEGIPFDLSQAEAKKIANVVLAMANSAPP